MLTLEEVYTQNILPLPTESRLKIAARILNDLTKQEEPVVDENTKESEEPRPLSALFAEIVADVPQEAWNHLPADLSKNIDHYNSWITAAMNRSDEPHFC